MKNYIVLFFALIVFGCTENKEVSKTEKSSSITENQNNIEYLFDLSLNTKLFLQELEKERVEIGIENYMPSDEFIEKYGIMFIDNDYSVDGFIKIMDNYNLDKLTKLNIKTNSKVGDIVIVIIPLKSIDNFLKQDGIKYFEISDKVELK